MMSHVVEQVTEIYQQIDTQTSTFQTATGLQCPPGCGQCCENPQIETTPLEMLPLAIELFQQGEAQKWLAAVAEVKESGRCVFYQPDPVIAGNGRCSVYLLRPAICRLFGFATVTNKQGKPELAVCIRHKQTMLDQVEIAKAAISEGLPAPNFSDFSMKLMNLEPSLASQRMPMNQALKVAIERVGLMMQFSNYSA